MNEQKFQLELERFKQKANWENKIFYAVLGFLISIILFYIKQEKVGQEEFWWWLGSLGIFLIIGELLVNCYLEKEKVSIKRLIGRKK